MTSPIERLKQLEKTLVPAPWKHDMGNWEVEGPRPDRIAICGQPNDDIKCDIQTHLEFIAEVRNMLPKLLAVYEASKYVGHDSQCPGDQECNCDYVDLKKALKALEEENAQ